MYWRIKSLRNFCVNSVLLFLFLLVSCSNQLSYSHITAVQIGSQKIPVELAITNEQKAIGLMNRNNLTGGMLFIYDNDEPRQFWMKNTLIPLDMIFIDSNDKIVKIHHALPCKNDPCRIYSSPPARYVLEVNYNYTAKNNIKENDEVSIR